MSKKIYLSPSNQIGNKYACGNTNEAEQCNRIAEYARIALQRCGFEVKKAPSGQDMHVTVNESNNWGADLHIPIHTNAGGGEGTVVFVYNKSENNMKYANPIYKNVQDVSLGTIDYGVRANPDLYELNATNCAAVYVEVDFHDSVQIANWIIENVEIIGEAICKGVCEAYSVKYIPAKAETIYRVQVGSFKFKKNAVAYLDKVKKSGFKDAFIVEVKL